MKKLQKLLLIWLFTFLWLFLIVPWAEARRGCCSRHGWVNYCASNGRYVCNDGSYSPTCTCNGWGYSSSYNRAQTHTKHAQPPQKSCSERYGRWATTNRDGSCGCTVGYEMKNNTCVSILEQKREACTKIENALFNYNSQECYCKTGYLYKDGQCISLDQSCKEVYWEHSISTSPEYCWCEEWYTFNQKLNKCEEKVNLCKDPIVQFSCNRNKEDCPSECQEYYLNEAKQYLWDKVARLKAIAEDIKSQTPEDQAIMKDIINRFRSSDDRYTRSIGIYMDELLK